MEPRLWLRVSRRQDAEPLAGQAGARWSPTGKIIEARTLNVLSIVDFFLIMEMILKNQ